jgi:hypothetical protein
MPGPHELDIDPQHKQKQKEFLDAIVAVSCKYLLFERENETAVRAALGSLAQERHNHFHTTGGAKEGDGTSFQECGNDICREVVDILQNYRTPSIEFNQITAEMMEEKFDLRVIKGINTVVVSLKDKSRIDEPPILPTPPEGTVIKV